MPLIIRNIRLDLDLSEDRLLALAAKKIKVPESKIRSFAVVRRSLDARKKHDIHFVYHIELAVDEPPNDERRRLETLRRQQAAWVEPPVVEQQVPGSEKMLGRPVVIGFGPAGMFAALRLAKLGYRPLVLERGREVLRRHRDVLQRFYKDGEFDASSNLLFGEGGAGAYSDGKLYTRVKGPLAREVMETLFHHGADPSILIEAGPHIGSDRLPNICTRIRNTIEALGGEVRFEQCVDDIRLVEQDKALSSDDGPCQRIGAVHVADPENTTEGQWIETGAVILAIGHSARDTIRMLDSRGVSLGTKPFQLGVRIEHPQEMINRWQYGEMAGHPRLGAADYRLVAKGVDGSKGDMFSFCMCPGGMILPSNESEGLIVTNGASRASRSGKFGNSGLVLTVDPAEMDLTPVGCLDYLRDLEAKAFKSTGGTYKVPAQRASDYLAGRRSEGDMEISYPLGGKWGDIRTLVPERVSCALDKALKVLDRRMPGFGGDNAILVAPETRASGPVRIPRSHESRESESVAGLYPAGEGAGFAGGIVSSAIDGIRSADKIIEKYAPAS